MADTDKLPSDQYYIRNENHFAGRGQHEDKSSNPKPVFCPTDAGQELWELTALPNGRYILRARGAPTGVMHKRLYAFLHNGVAEEWVITRREHEGHRPVYTIETASRKAGWVAETDHHNTQVHVVPLKEGRSHPPHFPSNELWNIQPLVN